MRRVGQDGRPVDAVALRHGKVRFDRFVEAGALNWTIPPLHERAAPPLARGLERLRRAARSHQRVGGGLRCGVAEV